MKNAINKGIQGAVLITIFSIIGNLVGYFTRLALARNLSVEDFGLFYAVAALLLFLLLFVNLGFGTALTKYLAQYHAEKNDEKKSRVFHFSSRIRIGMAVLLTFFLIILAPFLSTYFFKTPAATPVLIIMSFTLLFFTLLKIETNIYWGLQRFFYVGLSQCLEKTGFFLMVLVLLLFGLPTNATLPAYAYLAGFILSALLLFFPLLKQKWLFTKGVKGMEKEFVTFAFAAFLFSMGTLIIGYIDTLMLTYFGSLEAVGIYNAVLPTAIVLAFIGKSLQKTLLPLSSELHAKKDTALLRQGSLLATRYSLLVVIPIATTFFTFPEQIISFLFGSAFIGGSMALKILSLGVIFLTLSYIEQGVLSGIGRPGKITKILFVVAGLNVVLNLLLIPFFGMEGAAIATTISYLCIVLLQWAALQWEWKEKISISLRGIIAGVVFWGAAIVTAHFIENLLGVIIGAIVGGLAFLLAARLLRMYTFEELVSLPKKILHKG